MDVLMVTAFVSLLLVVAGIVLFVSRVKAGDFEHGDRLSLLPLADDERPDASSNPVPQDAADTAAKPRRGGSA
ncbi:MAG TPA: cytochrome oxidase [Candidatus Krumholzibacteria bacterium]|nr:cytochrome oxidase [Candidatus Krumholzibacteria bacterium]HRX51604.1 cytochrome oxidase [Candidatus Krumholzibacteria bacterium]